MMPEILVLVPIYAPTLAVIERAHFAGKVVLNPLQLG